MFYFKEPTINKYNYTEALENIKKTLSQADAYTDHKSEKPIYTIKALTNELIKTHIAEFGVKQTKQDLRLLGNAIRIASQTSQEVLHATQQIIWGINANALDFMSSGESSCLSEALEYIKKKVDIPVIFDIGANTGRWSKLVISSLNTFSLHIFEPNTSLKEELTNNIIASMTSRNPDAQAHLNMTGIGNQGKGKLFISNISNELATTVLNSERPIYDNYEELEITLTRGSTYCKTRRVNRIDYLKIDTEGSELAALKSFGAYIEKGKIKFIQFEYGKPSLFGDSKLSDFFELLESQYSIHRILPEGITEQLKYSAELESFEWSNYLAIHKENLDLLGQFEQQTPLA